MNSQQEITAKTARESRRPPSGTAVQDTRLRVVDVRKSFAAPNGERIEVLRGVDFELKAGESVAIMGASGAGKSTLLHLLGGLDEPDHGSISLGSCDLGRLDLGDLPVFRQRQIGFVFQFHYLLPDLTALENVAMPLLIGRYGSRASLAEARNLLRQFGLEDRADHPVSHLSGGEQQRVAVARAIIRQPSLVLADEPTGNLDSAISEEIGKRLVNYTRSQSAMTVIATHSEMLARHCDRVLVLKAGKIYSC
jgi:lipoprotein-releasing system ATP-binding protein